tara:strand:+ start:5464 stop:5958 length:495 start_codon:yes stop_codon:yes gene_type:complete
MALTQSAWAAPSTVNGLSVSSCTVVSTTAETDAYTLKTPSFLDPKKQWSMSYSASATPDGSALPLDIWFGYNDNFVLSGQGGSVIPTNSNGGKFKEIFNDVVLAVTTLKYVFNFDPDLAVADVVTVAAIATGPKVKIPVAPYYVFNLNGASTLAAVTHTFTIIQ